jgi:glutathione synthase/RimK-type ligase-like ATP-grasp enzyme
MLNSQRVFVDAVRQYCARNNVSVELGSQGWVIIMQRGAQRQLAFGYDLGLNSAVAHRIANDKAATSEVLQLADIPCIPHTLFLNPSLYEYVPPQRSWERMLRLIEDHPAGLVVKPNDGTSGKSVHKVMTESDLEVAAHRIFASNQSLAVSPYVEIQQEIRVVVLDDQPIVAYGKQRPSVVGDGKRSVLELVLAGTPRAKRAGILTSAFESSDNAELDSIPPPGQRRVVSWRHNLDSGAQPVLLEQGADRDACVEIARRAASAINIRFGSIDVVQVGGSWKILEINSGVMMEALSGSHPELVFAAYSAALDKVFGQTRV